MRGAHFHDITPHGQRNRLMITRFAPFWLYLGRCCGQNSQNPTKTACRRRRSALFAFVPLEDFWRKTLQAQALRSTYLL